MNAVNLIPGDRKRVTVSVSPLTLGVIGGLVVVLAAAVLYVFAVNDVRSRKDELGRVTANAASWQAAANSYASYVTDAEQQKQQLADIQQLVTGRFPWSVLLSQIGGVMPANAALSSLQATSPSADSTAATGTATPGAPASIPTSPTTPTTQAVQITGCAASQSAVASTMVALGRVHGVGSVALASTSNSTAGATSSGSSTSSSAGSSSSDGGCPFPVNFTLSLVLAPSASSTSTPASATPTSSAAASTTTPTASTAPTSSTGSAQ
jgi:Tfp pilus assembly protein PilN